MSDVVLRLFNIAMGILAVTCIILTALLGIAAVWASIKLILMV